MSWKNYIRRKVTRKIFLTVMFHHFRFQFFLSINVYSRNYNKVTRKLTERIKKTVTRKINVIVFLPSILSLIVTFYDETLYATMYERVNTSLIY
jgi:hypothetical protein